MNPLYRPFIALLIVLSLSGFAMANSNAETAKALFEKGFALQEQDEHNDAIAIYDEIDERFGKDESPAVREQVVKALFNKALSIGGDYIDDDASATYEEIERRFGEDNSPDIRKWVAKAFFKKNFSQWKFSNSKDSILTLYKTFDRRFGKDQTPEMREWLAIEMVNQGDALWYDFRSDDSIAVYDEVERRFGKDDFPAVRKRIAEIFKKGDMFFDIRGESSPVKRMKGFVLAMQVFNLFNDFDTKKDIRQAAYEKFERYIARNNSIDMRKLATAVRCYRSGRLKDPKASYDPCRRPLRYEINRMNEDTDENAAQKLLLEAFDSFKQNEFDDAIAINEEIDRRFGKNDSPAIRTTVALALSNKGFALEKQGKTDAAIAVYEEIERRFAKDSFSDIEKLLEGTRRKINELKQKNP